MANILIVEDELPINELTGQSGPFQQLSFVL